jgi:hypothetical protein
MALFPSFSTRLCSLFQMGNCCPLGVMQGLILDVAHHPTQLTFTKGNHAVLALPGKFIIGTDDVIHEMRTAALHFANKPGQCQSGRNGGDQMNMV